VGWFRKSAPATKSASFFLGMPAGTFMGNSATYQTLANEGYAANAIVNACVTRIANSIASVDLQVYKKKGAKLVKQEAHPLLNLLENPNPAQSGDEFIRHFVSYYLVGGDSYVLGNGIDPNRMKSKPPTELQLLNPGKVQVKPGSGFFPAAYEYRPSPSSLMVYPVNPINGNSSVLQVKTFNPLNPWNGLPPMVAAAYGVDIFNSGQKWNKRLLDNDARPSGALKITGSDGKPMNLSDEQHQRLKEQIDSQFSGSNNAGRPLLLEGGLEWQEMSMNAKDMDFLQGKYSSARDIGLVYGVPSQLLGIPGDSTFANYEQATLSFWTDTVIPLLVLILESFNRWLTPLYGDDLYLWFDEDSIAALEPRRKQKAERIQAAAYLTINEKRRAMGLDDVEGGDTVFVPSSSIPLDIAGSVSLPEPGSPADQA
jgi:HK97 family phage portal protein